MLASIGAVVGCGGSATYGSLVDPDGVDGLDPDTGPGVLEVDLMPPSPKDAGRASTVPPTRSATRSRRAASIASPTATVVPARHARRTSASLRCLLARRVSIAHRHPMAKSATRPRVNALRALPRAIARPTTIALPTLQAVHGVRQFAGLSEGAGVCAPDLKRCVECVGANDCTADQTCAGNTCRKKCTSDTQCTKMGFLCDLTRGYCVACVGAVDCKAEEYCLNGACAGDVCAAGSSSCESNRSSPAGPMERWFRWSVRLWRAADMRRGPRGRIV